MLFHLLNVPVADCILVLVVPDVYDLDAAAFINT